METLIVLPGASPIHKRDETVILVDSKDFTLHWCCNYIAAYQLRDIQIWASDDPSATAFALGRARSENNITIILTKSVWDGLEGVYKIDGASEEDIAELKSMCYIVEDLNGSN